jgi:hypothetical protein
MGDTIIYARIYLNFATQNEVDSAQYFEMVHRLSQLVFTCYFCRFIMLSMSEFLKDNQAETERVMLWDDIVGIFEEYAYTAGLQISPRSPTKIVLVSNPQPEDEYVLQLWGIYGGDTAAVTPATLIFNDLSGREVISYEMTPDSIKTYGPAKPADFDKETLQDLRDELSSAQWDPQASEQCARSILFFTP